MERAKKIGKWISINKFKLLVLLGCLLLASITGFPAGLGSALDKLSNDLELTIDQQTILEAFGITGLFFTLPAGLLLDKFGELFVIIIGSLLAIIGWIAMSFCNNSIFWLLVICYSMTGFGAGSVMIAALSAAMKAFAEQPGTSVSLVSAINSLSMGIATLIIKITTTITSCGEDNCWRLYFRVIGCFVAIFSIVGTILVRYKYKIIYAKKSDLDGVIENLLTETDSVTSITESASIEPTSFFKSLKILCNLYFLSFALSYTINISAGLIVVTDRSGIWTSFTGTYNANAIDNIGIAFSVTTVIGGLLSGWLSDYLANKASRIKTYHLSGLVMIGYSIIFLLMTLIMLLPIDNRSSLASQIFFGLFLSLIGALWGMSYTIYPASVVQVYGQENFGIYFGYIQLLPVVATFVVPIINTAIFEATGFYTISFFIMAILLIVTAIPILFIKPTRITIIN
eukprot:TRINITY_DN7172_c0_g1_i1.p1 TRINITY_DN7172_c0_g1~~TRINITY_DN7172_c0_g1_i1.p1  ORF type:complete len:456 (+),score=121.90 TRINITY_DN7172_c0_g1_i1:48-1415(+)